MGIEGLTFLIKEIGKDYAMQFVPLERLRGMTVAVDTSLMVHQTVIAIRNSGKDLINKKGELTSHIYGVFHKIMNLLQHGIIPIFVFDGKVPDIKNETLKKRSEKKGLAKKKMEEINDSEDENYIKNFKQTFTPNEKTYDDIRILLDLMGIPYINAPEEADPVCVWLTTRYNPETNKKYAKGVFSDDSDMLPLGSPLLFKRSLKFMAREKGVTVINLHRAIAKLNLTKDQFIDMCVLMGCDYCPKIKGIGKKSAYNLIKKHGDLESVISFLKKHGKLEFEDTSIPLEDHVKRFYAASKYFRTAVKKLDDSDDFVISNDNILPRMMQYDELQDYLCAKQGFDVDKIKESLNNLQIYYKKMNITKPNTKRVHIPDIPVNQNPLLRSIDIDSIEFLSDDEVPTK
jgi:flap endonuclease-1